MTPTYETIPSTSIGMTTLVGYLYCDADKWPRAAGNCFSLDTEKGSYRIVNFNCENFEELLRRKVIEWPVQIHPLSERIAVVHDPRIPAEWYETQFCEVCCSADLLPLPQMLARSRDVLSGKRTERMTDAGFMIVSTRLGYVETE